MRSLKRRQQRTRTTPNERERRFVEFYMGKAAGNATKAAEEAGYSKKTARFQGARLLTNVNIQKGLQARVDADPLVADREALQRLWTKIAFARKPYAKARMKDRLRASELLGKSQGLFVIKHEIDPRDDLATLLGRLPLMKNP